MRRLTSFAAALPALLLALPAGAQHVIDFSDYASPVATEHQATYGNPVTAGGLAFYESSLYNGNSSRNVLGTWGTSDGTAVHIPSNANGSTALFATALGVEIDILAQGSDPVLGLYDTFGLTSIDVAHLYSNPTSPFTLTNFTLTFFAADPEFNVFSQSFTVAAPPLVNGVRTPVLQTLVFDNRFANVINVWWNQGTGSGTAHQFTNVAVVPEPGTWVLMLTGLGGVGVVGLRRRRATVA